MAVPTITAISPASGLSAGGAVVSITGTNLASATGVNFGATAATVFSSLSSTQVVANAPAGTGIVDVTVTTAGGTSAAVAVDQFSYSDGLFTVADARAFMQGQVSDAAAFSDAAIVAEEAQLRSRFAQICRVDFVPTIHADEYHAGDNTAYLMLDWPKVTAVTAGSLRSGASATWVALTSDQLLAIQPSDTGELYWDGGWWPDGMYWIGASFTGGRIVRPHNIARHNVKLSYVAGHVTVPPVIKDAALRSALLDLMPSNLGLAASEYVSEGMTASYSVGDGFNGNWDADPRVRRALRLYSLNVGGIA